MFPCIASVRVFSWITRQNWQVFEKCFSYQCQQVQTVLTVWNDGGEQTFLSGLLQNKWERQLFPDSSSSFVWHYDAYYRWTAALMSVAHWTPSSSTVSGFCFSEPCVRCPNDYHFPMYESKYNSQKIRDNSRRVQSVRDYVKEI